MKRLPLILLLSLISCVLLSQNSDKFFKVIPLLNSDTPDWARLMYTDNPNVGEVEDLYQAYYSEHVFVKNIHTQNHKFWLKRVAKYINQDGYIVLPSKEEEDRMMAEMKKKYESRLSLKSGVKEVWEAQGQFNTYHPNTNEESAFHANVYSIDRSLSNPNMLICGTETGGVYISKNKGLHWESLTKGEVFSDDIEAVKIHPSNDDVLFISGNDRIFKTADGGLTWSDKIWLADNASEFIFHPTDAQTIFAPSKSGLFKSADGGESWVKVFSQSCWDIEFHPGDPSIVYLLKSSVSQKQSELFRSTDGGVTWLIEESGWYVPSDLEAAQEFGGKIAVSPAEPDWVYVGLIGNSKEGDNGWIGLYKSTDSGKNWHNTAGQDGSPYGKVNDPGIWNIAALGTFHQGFYNFDLEVSPSNADLIWVGTIRLSESSDGGNNFISIGGYSSDRMSGFHSDIQDIEVYDDEIWVATDGGVCKSTDNLNSVEHLNEGIDAIDFRGFGTGWNEDSYIGGRWHNGTAGWYQNHPFGKAKRIGGIEEPTGYVHPIESRKMYFATNYSQSTTSVTVLSKSFEDKNASLISLPIKPTEYSNPGERGSMVFDPRYSNHIIIGSGYKIYKSTDAGLSFEEIYAFSRSGRVYEIEMSRSNPDVMYAVIQPFISYFLPSEIWKSIDGGKTWNKTLSDPEGNRMRYRISIDPTDDQKIWACVPRSNAGYQVHYSSDGGDTWENRTTPLIESEFPMDILMQGGSNNMAYLACKSGLYYWDEDKRVWEDYSEGLPLVPSSLQLNPFYRDAELRLASRGRGVWSRMMKDTSFVPIAQPITYSDSVLCQKDTVQFDCYSILNHENAKWNWEFLPVPQFVDDVNARNPKVVFGATGSYTVSLTVIDKYGNSDTKSIPDMVTVVQNCQIDTVPGLAMKCDGSSAYAQTPPLDLMNTNAVTMSAWVKPNGIQSSLTAIIYNDILLFGMLFGKENKLEFKWPSVSSFGSDLFLEDGKWSHVAMVVAPDSISLYLNGKAFKVKKSIPKTDFGSLKIGSYKGISSRNFQGEIDEVCIWNKSLSEDEIRSLRHLTRTGVMPYTDNLLLYYQFNSEDAGKVIDRYGTNHGVLTPGAIKVPSLTPVGSGVSDILTVSSVGDYLFPNSQTQLSVDNEVSDQQWVVTRLNTLPNELPNTNPHAGNYWILNTYGDNPNPIAKLIFKPSIGSAVGDPGHARLFLRGDNEGQNNWEEKCASSTFVGGNYVYSSDCAIDSSAQIFLLSNDDENIKKTYEIKNVELSLCAPDSVFLENEYQHESGMYRDTVFVNEFSDSVYITTLTVVSIDVSVLKEEKSLTSNEEDSEFRWLDCNDNFETVIGELESSFIPTETGNYAVEISKKWCVDTSSCYQITVTGILETDWAKSMVIFPNPTKENITIKLAGVSREIICRILSPAGKLISEYIYRDVALLEVEIPSNKGEYIIELNDGVKKASFTILKN